MSTFFPKRIYKKVQKFVIWEFSKDKRTTKKLYLKLISVRFNISWHERTNLKVQITQFGSKKKKTEERKKLRASQFFNLSKEKKKSFRLSPEEGRRFLHNTQKKRKRVGKLFHLFFKRKPYLASFRTVPDYALEKRRVLHSFPFSIINDFNLQRKKIKPTETKTKTKKILLLCHCILPFLIPN